MSDRIKAGEAFSNTEGFENTKIRLRAFGLALESIGRGGSYKFSAVGGSLGILVDILNSQEYQALKQSAADRYAELCAVMAEEIQRAKEQAKDILSKKRLPQHDETIHPDELDYWVHLARVTEFDPDKLNSGAYNLDDVWNHALAWADRQLSKEKIKADALTVADSFEIHCKTYKGTHRDKAIAWLKLHPDDKRTLDQVKKASERIPHE